MEHFEVITDAVTGEQTTRPLTSQEVAALTALPPKTVQEEARRAAYQLEADPLFFMAQRGEATMAEWQAKVTEIKARFPYPAE